MPNSRTIKEFKVVLTTITPLRIGGKDDPMSGRGENTTVSFGDMPVVPGPSLKGALRAAVERYLIEESYDQERGGWPAARAALQPCVPADRPSGAEKDLIDEHRYRNGPCSYTGNQAEVICPACYILGAQGLVGFVSVPFLVAKARTAQGLYSLRIDRATGAGPAGRGLGGNRPYEVVRPGVDFEGTLRVLMEDPILQWRFGEPRVLGNGLEPDAWLNPGVWDDRPDLVELVKQLLESIDTIGGYKSRGCGRVKIEVTEIK